MRGVMFEDWMTTAEAKAYWETLTDDQQTWVTITADMLGASKERIVNEHEVPSHKALQMNAPGLTYKQKQRRKK